MKNFISVLIVFLLLLGCNSGSQPNGTINDEQVMTPGTGPESPDNTAALEKYNAAYSKWSGSGTENYYLKIRYGAFSPLQGVWEIEVTGGSLSKWVFNGNLNMEEYRTAAEKMTMNSLSIQLAMTG